MTTRGTPATFAGIRFISTEEGYAAVPPGTYSPARSIGTTRWPKMTPSPSSVNQDSCTCFSWKRRMLASACTSASLEPSYVLKSLGVGDELAHSSLRLSLGRFNTEEEVERMMARIVELARG